MKIRIINIKHLAVHDGDGIRTTVFLKGCSLKCKWCHNPESISYEKQLAFREDKCINCMKCEYVCKENVHNFIDNKHLIEFDKCTFCNTCVSNCFKDALTIYGHDIEPIELLNELMEDKEFYQSSNGGVTFSGGEPLLQIKELEPLLKELKKENISINFDTCGNVSFDAFKKSFPYVDTFLYDIKHSDPKKHKSGTGCDNNLIIKNLKLIDDLGFKTEIRIPLIPGFNDDEETLKNIGLIIKSLKNCKGFKVLPYHSLAKSKYKSINIDFHEFNDKKIEANKATSIINEILINS